MHIAIATGIAELDGLLKESLKDKGHSPEIVHMRSYLVDENFEVIIFTPKVEQNVYENRFKATNLLHTLKSQGKRVILVPGDDDELVQAAVKYAIHDIIIGEIDPIMITEIVDNPMSFNDISYLIKDIPVIDESIVHIEDDIVTPDTEDYHEPDTHLHMLDEEPVIEKIDTHKPVSQVAKRIDRKRVQEPEGDKKKQRPEIKEKVKKAKPVRKQVESSNPRDTSAIKGLIPKVGDTVENFRQNIKGFHGLTTSTGSNEPTIVYKSPNLEGYMTIKMAVMGTSTMVGTTQSCISIAKYFAMDKNKVAIMNMSGNPDAYKYLEMELKNYSDTEDLNLPNSIFTFSKIDFYKDPSDIDKMNPSSKYNVIIYDIGTDYTYNSINSNIINFSTYRFVVAPAAKRHRQTIIKMIMEHPDFKDFAYILPMGSKKDVKSTMDFLQNKSVYALPYEPDRRVISDATMEQLVTIFNQRRGK